VFNSELLVPNVPKRPAKSCPAYPKDPTSSSLRARDQPEEICEGRRVPGGREQLPHCAPQKFCEDTFEENVIGVLRFSTQRTDAVSGATMFLDVIA
jgi:hypothetical protein